MPSNKFHSLLQLASLLALVSMAVVPMNATAQIAVTGGTSTDSISPVAATSNLTQFIDQVKNGSTQQITGLYVESLFSYPVVQQPGGQPAFVSTNDNQVTQFQSASSYGSLGFVAHNTLAGVKFPEIQMGEVITLVYGDGHFTQYQVSQIRQLQALQPNNPYTSFVDLSNNQTLTVEDVFYQTYGVSGQLVLQTCIASQGNDSWGRLFVIAVPYTPTAYELPIPSIFTLRMPVRTNFRMI